MQSIQVPGVISAAHPVIAAHGTTTPSAKSILKVAHPPGRHVFTNRARRFTPTMPDIESEKPRNAAGINSLEAFPYVARTN
jgi:hypothetical protein